MSMGPEVPASTALLLKLDQNGILRDGVACLDCNAMNGAGHRGGQVKDKLHRLHHRERLALGNLIALGDMNGGHEAR